MIARRVLASLAVVIGAAAAAQAQQSPARGGSAAPPQDTVRVATEAMSDSALDAATAAVAVTLRCPVCKGVSIQDSPADLAQEMRAVVRDQLRAGKTPDEVRAYFVDRYGEWILLDPMAKGLNLLVYVLPIALVFGGIGFIALLVRRWTRAPAVSASAEESPTQSGVPL